MDAFVSYKSQDREGARNLVRALESRGLEVWFDENRLDDFDPITKEILEGLARSKVFVAWYSKQYATSRPCQWELTTAYLAAQVHGSGAPLERILLVNLESGVDHIPQKLLHDQHLGDPSNPDALAEKIAERAAAAITSLGDIRPTDATPWHGTWKGLGSQRWVGRLHKLWQLHELLTGSDAAIITGATRPAQVIGLGGQGKSLLAEEYALRFGPAYPGGVFWLRAYGHDDSKAGLDASQREAERDGQIRQFAIDLGVPVEDPEPALIRGALDRRSRSAVSRVYGSWTISRPVFAAMR